MILPDELWLIVAEFLPLADLKALSVTGKRISRLVDRHVYRSVSCQWEQLPAFCAQKFAKHVQYLKIRGSGEWKYSPQLNSLEWPHLRQLTMSMHSSSSAWLKYIKNLQLESLKVVCPRDGVHYFDFDHLHNQPSLGEIQLLNLILVTPESPHPSLHTVQLRDCVWDYPNDPAEIGDIKSLTISLSHFNPFAFSERLQHTSNNLPPQVEHFELHLHLDSRVSWKPLRNGSKSIKHLSLKGFEPVSTSLFPNLISLREF